MKSLKFIVPALCMVVGISAAQAADSGMWTLGPNLGFSTVSASGGGGSTTSIGIPNGGGLLFGSIQPGMRIGHIAAGGAYDVFLDLGVNHASSNGSSLTTVLSTLNVQYNFSPEANATPYLTGGGGLSHIGGDFLTSETDAMFGLGLGIRCKVSDGHGGLRAEARYDRLVVTGGSLNSFALKLGADLWIP